MAFGSRENSKPRLLAGNGKEILVKDNRAIGVKTSLGLEIKAKSVVLTNGTFLNGLIHIGEKTLEVEGPQKRQLPESPNSHPARIRKQDE